MKSTLHTLPNYVPELIGKKYNKYIKDNNKIMCSFYERLIFGLEMNKAWTALKKQLQKQSDFLIKEYEEDDYVPPESITLKSLLFHFENMAEVNYKNQQQFSEYADALPNIKKAHESIKNKSKNLGHAFKRLYAEPSGNSFNDDIYYYPEINKRDLDKLVNFLNEDDWLNQKIERYLLTSKLLIGKYLCDANIDILNDSSKSLHKISQEYENLIKQKLIKDIASRAVSLIPKAFPIIETLESIEEQAESNIFFVATEENKYPIKNNELSPSENHKNRWRKSVIQNLAQVFNSHFGQPLTGQISMFASAILDEAISGDQVKNALRRYKL